MSNKPQEEQTRRLAENQRHHVKLSLDALASAGLEQFGLVDGIEELVRQRDEALADSKMWGGAINAAWAAATPHSTMTVGTELSDVIRDFIRQRDEARAGLANAQGLIAELRKEQEPVTGEQDKEPPPGFKTFTFTSGHAPLGPIIAAKPIPPLTVGKALKLVADKADELLDRAAELAQGGDDYNYERERNIMMSAYSNLIGFVGGLRAAVGDTDDQD